MYYTYAYLRESGTPYYIGKGSNDRAYQKHMRNNGQNLLPKNRNRILILKRFDLEEDAYKHEKYLIALYGRKCDGGILVNMVHGGKGGARKYLTRKEKEDAKLKNKIRAVELRKKWREENREEFNAKTNKRNAKRREILNQRQKEYADKNREKINEKQREYRKKNMEEVRKREREYYAKNKQKINEQKRKNILTVLTK